MSHEICTILPPYFRQTRTKIRGRIVQISCDKRRLCVILIKMSFSRGIFCKFLDQPLLSSTFFKKFRKTFKKFRKFSIFSRSFQKLSGIIKFIQNYLPFFFATEVNLDLLFNGMKATREKSKKLVNQL